MAKEYHNMTPKERMKYWEKMRKKERIERKIRIDRLSNEQRAAVVNLHSTLQSILDTALDVDMGGIKAVSLFEMQELQYAADKLHFEFNLNSDENT